MGRYRDSLTALGVLILGLVIFAIFCFLSLRSVSGGSPEEISRIDLAWKLTAGVLGLIGIAIGLMRLEQGERRLKLDEANERQQRFERAWTHFASDSQTIALGGLWTMESLAQESRYFHKQIFDMLTRFVKEKAPFDFAPAHSCPPSLASRDRALVRECFRAVGCRDASFDDGSEPISLSFCDLQFVSIDGGCFDSIEFEWTIFEHATFSSCSFREAKFKSATFSNVRFEKCDFTDAVLAGATMSNVKFDSCVGLAQGAVNEMDGDKTVTLPEGIVRPDEWANREYRISRQRRDEQARRAEERRKKQQPD